MGEQAVEHMRDRGIERILVANRSRERGEELAKRVGGELVPWEGVAAALRLPDIIVSSIGGADPVFTRPTVERAMAERSNRALFIIDLGVPRNVPAEIGDLYSVYLYNIDDLTEIVEQNKKARENEIPRAEALIEEHVAKFEAWQGSMEATSLLNELQTKLKREREAFLRDRLEPMQHLSSADREQMARLMEELLDRVVIEPAERLRSRREFRRKLAAVEALRELFGLDREKP